MYLPKLATAALRVLRGRQTGKIGSPTWQVIEPRLLVTGSLQVQLVTNYGRIAVRT